MTELGRATGAHTVTMEGHPELSFDLSWSAVTDIGRKRKQNQDSFLAETPLFVVADGMGGHSSGDIASGAVVGRLSESIHGEFITPESIVEALRAATTDITLADDAAELGVGTTVTGAALVLSDGEPHWAIFNVGDSRVYLFAGERLVQVTVDHSVVQELVDAGLLRAEDAEYHPDSNVITRAVGFNAEPLADVWLLPVRADERLLICSDGLTREVNAATLVQHLAAGLGAEATAAALVQAALIAGGRDNVTAIVVDVAPATP